MKGPAKIAIGVAVVALALAFFYFRSSQETLLIQNAFMMPTIGNGDFIKIDPSIKKSLLRRGDVVMYEITKAPGIRSVGRLIGLPKDQVAFEAGRVILNGKSLQAEGASKLARTPEGTEVEEFQETVDGKSYSVWTSSAGDAHTMNAVDVGEDAYFIVSDNRASGHDSRKLGPIPASGLRGKVLKIESSATADRGGKDL